MPRPSVLPAGPPGPPGPPPRCALMPPARSSRLLHGSWNGAVFLLRSSVIDGNSFGAYMRSANSLTYYFREAEANSPLGAEENLTYHEVTLRQVLTEMGYQVKSINEGLAVIYSELESTNYTGIGISCGGGLCNVCVAYLSVPVMSFSIPKAGDYIDTNAASVTGELANRVRIAKEDSFHFNGFHADKLLQVLGVYYDEMIQSLVQGIKQAFSISRNLPKQKRPLPVVLSGGTALPEGFRDRFEKTFKEANLPIPTSEIRMAADPLHTSAKGALVAALADL